jgi:hypothetical protein
MVTLPPEAELAKLAAAGAIAADGAAAGAEYPVKVSATMSAVLKV